MLTKKNHVILSVGVMTPDFSPKWGVKDPTKGRISKSSLWWFVCVSFMIGVLCFQGSLKNGRGGSISSFEQRPQILAYVLNIWNITQLYRDYEKQPFCHYRYGSRNLHQSGFWTRPWPSSKNIATAVGNGSRPLSPADFWVGVGDT